MLRAAMAGSEHSNFLRYNIYVLMYAIVNGYERYEFISRLLS